MNVSNPSRHPVLVMLTNRNVLKVTACAAMIAFGAVMLYGTFAPSDKAPRRTYYYDLASGDLFTAPVGRITPIAVNADDASSTQPQGVRAYVYACGSCRNPDARYIAWIEMHNPQYSGAEGTGNGRQGGTSPAFRMLMLNERSDGVLVRRVADKAWTPRNTPEGRQLMAGARGECADGIKPVRCEP